MSYNLFPVETRRSMLREFLKSYRFKNGQDMWRCIDVFENVTAEVFARGLLNARRRNTRKYGRDMEIWKKHPPHGLFNKAYWRGLCDIWAKEGWKEMSETNRTNRIKYGPLVTHLGGSRSFHKHKIFLSAQQKREVSDYEVFDHTHTRTTPTGKEYVNEKAAEAVEKYKVVKEGYGDEPIPESKIWDVAVGGERRGRVFGKGHRSRTRKVRTPTSPIPRASRTTRPSRSVTRNNPTKSTATSAETEKELYSKAEVKLLLDKIAEQKKEYADALAETKREAAEGMESNKQKLEELRVQCKANELTTNALFELLFKLTGQRSLPQGEQSGCAGGASDGAEAKKGC